LPAPHSKGRYEALVIIVSVALVAGMAVASLLLLTWKTRPALVAAGSGMRAAVAVCPPFMLVPIIGASDDSALSNVILGATVVLGNGSLYAGLAAFAYWAMETFVPKRPRS
jgi:hypothetical protein